MAKLGGAPGRPDREERLEKLLASCAYGGAAVPDAPRSKQPKERPKERQKPPMAAHRAKSSGAVSTAAEEVHLSERLVGKYEQISRFLMTFACLQMEHMFDDRPLPANFQRMGSSQRAGQNCAG